MCRSAGAYKELHRVLFANDVTPRWGFISPLSLLQDTQQQVMIISVLFTNTD